MQIKQIFFSRFDGRWKIGGQCLPGCGKTQQQYNKEQYGKNRPDKVAFIVILIYSFIFHLPVKNIPAVVQGIITAEIARDRFHTISYKIQSKPVTDHLLTRVKCACTHHHRPFSFTYVSV